MVCVGIQSSKMTHRLFQIIPVRMMRMMEVILVMSCIGKMDRDEVRVNR